MLFLSYWFACCSFLVSLLLGMSSSMDEFPMESPSGIFSGNGDPYTVLTYREYVTGFSIIRPNLESGMNGRNQMSPDRGAQRGRHRLYRTAMCPTQDCRNRQCNFAHSSSELRAMPQREKNPKFKTQTCRSVLQDQVCTYGEKCHFWHPWDDEGLGKEVVSEHGGSRKEGSRLRDKDAFAKARKERLDALVSVNKDAFWANCALIAGMLDELETQFGDSSMWKDAKHDTASTDPGRSRSSTCDSGYTSFSAYSGGQQCDYSFLADFTQGFPFCD